MTNKKLTDLLPILYGSTVRLRFFAPSIRVTEAIPDSPSSALPRNTMIPSISLRSVQFGGFISPTLALGGELGIELEGGAVSSALVGDTVGLEVAGEMLDFDVLDKYVGLRVGRIGIGFAIN